MLTSPTPLQLRDFLRQPRVADVFQLGQRQRFGGDRERQDRRVGRIDLGVDRRRRQVARQQVVRRIDRRLHFLLGDVEAEIETELQRDDRGAGRARRRHLVQAGHLAELPLQAERSPTTSSLPGWRPDRTSVPGWSDNRPAAGPRAAGRCRRRCRTAGSPPSAASWRPDAE